MSPSASSTAVNPSAGRLNVAPELAMQRTSPWRRNATRGPPAGLRLAPIQLEFWRSNALEGHADLIGPERRTLFWTPSERRQGKPGWQVDGPAYARSGFRGPSEQCPLVVRQMELVHERYVVGAERHHDGLRVLGGIGVEVVLGSAPRAGLCRFRVRRGRAQQ